MAFNFQTMDGTPPAISAGLRMTAASFTSAVTVNTTGTAALAANTGRLLGVWCANDTNSVVGLIGSTINNAVMRIVPAGTTNGPQPLFVPGTGAIYVKTVSGIANFSFMEY